MEVADGIHRFGTRMVNWYLIERGGRLTLVDAGMRGYWPQLTRALAGREGRFFEDPVAAEAWLLEDEGRTALRRTG